MNYIQTGTTELITVYAIDSSSEPLTALTDIYVRLMRISDSFFYDWDSSTFKSTGWITLNKILTEVDATRAPGIYEVTGGLSTTGLSGDYMLSAVQTPGTTATLPVPEPFRVGVWVDKVYDTDTTVTAVGTNTTTTRKFITNRKILTPTTMKTYDDDNVTLIGTQTVTDITGANITLPAGTPAKTTKAV